MMKTTWNILLILLCTNSIWGQTNEGTNLWFAFLEHRDVGQNTMVVMITSKFNTSGVVNMPNINWSRTFQTTANEVTIVSLPISAETIGSEVVRQTGVQITSQQPVSAYLHQYHAFRSEAAVVLPIESIGNEYFVMTYQGLDNNGTVYPSEFLIVATENNTEVFIELSDATQNGRQRGDVISIELNAGEVFQVQARFGSSDLTGTHIIGDKNFAVFAGNTWTEVPVFCGPRDNLMEQMYPISTWGKQFVSVPSAEVNYDTFRILASEDNTTVSVQNDQAREYFLNAGEYVEYNSGIASYIEASNPIMVAQYNVGSGCSGYNLGDPSMVLLNSVEQTLDSVTLYNSSFQAITENYINIILSQDDKENVFFDGQRLNSLTTIFDVPNSSFAYARLQVNSGSHNIISDGCGIIATAYGYGEAESYAYSGGARFSPINTNPIIEGGCLNDTITFDTRLSPKKYSFEWDFGNGDVSTAATPKRIYTALGTYPVSLIVTDNCLSQRDTFQKDIEISLRQAVEALDFVQVCQGEPVELTATDVTEADYIWQGPNSFRSIDQNPSILNTLPLMSGKYSVVGIVSGCATFPAYTDVEVVPTPEPNLGKDTLVCTRGDSLSIMLAPGDFATYRWQDGSNNSIFEVRQEGRYTVEVADEFGCRAETEVFFELQCPASFYAPSIFSPNADDENDNFQIYTDEILQIHLQIFDRWGSLIFETKDVTIGWDGNIQDEPAEQGIYVWSLSYEGYDAVGNLFTDVASGSVMLIR